MSKGLKISDDLTLPLELVTQTQVILAKKGAGKTYTAAVEIEEALKLEQQVVVLDPTGAWWGLKSTADGERAGFAIAIFGGEHADIPLEESAGEVVATAIVERQFSAVIDLSLFRKGQMHRFLVPFLETLYRINRNSLLLVVDEADFAAPQKPFGEEARTLGAMQDIVRRGRIRGLGCAMITQRPQVLNKDVLTQADMLVALRMNHPKDLAAVKEWVDVHADPAVAKEMIQSLPSLPTGTAWFWAPGSDLLKKTQVRRRTTFDSSATPKPGQRVKAPKALATVDIEKLGAEISATVQRAKENSPTELKAKIRALEAEIAKKPTHVVSESTINELETVKQRITLLERDLENAHRAKAMAVQALEDFAAQFSAKVAELGSIRFEDARTTLSRLPPPRIEVQRPARVPARPPAEPLAVGDALSGPEQRILNALAWMEAIGVSEPEQPAVAFLAGYTYGSGGYNNPRGRLRQRGLVEYLAGDRMKLTEPGRKMAQYPDIDPSNEALHDAVLGRLPGPESKILTVLLNHYPKSMDAVRLAEAAGYTPGSGGFNNPRGRLKTLGLVDYPSAGMVVAKPLLFPEGPHA